MTLHFDESTDLSGLDMAIRLKADLLHRLRTLPTPRWADRVVAFVSALERVDLRDATALVVLLAELREEIRLLVGVGEPPRVAPDVAVFDRAALKAWAGLPPARILAQFKDQIVRLLLPAAPKASLSPIAQHAKAIIEARYSEPLTGDDLAVAVGCSKRHLATLFRTEVGMTVHEYLIRVRLRQGLDLIRRGEKIEAVSLLVGYRSKVNFYRHFKAYTGLTPREYRTVLVRIDRSV